MRSNLKISGKALRSISGTQFFFSLGGDLFFFSSINRFFSSWRNFFFWFLLLSEISKFPRHIKKKKKKITLGFFHLVCAFSVGRLLSFSETKKKTVIDTLEKFFKKIRRGSGEKTIDRSLEIKKLFWAVGWPKILKKLCFFLLIDYACFSEIINLLINLWWRWEIIGLIMKKIIKN